MAREVLQNVNLLKKYHHTTVYDYTEYPTKAFWSEDMKDQAYRDALTGLDPALGRKPGALLRPHALLRGALLLLPLQQGDHEGVLAGDGVPLPAPLPRDRPAARALRAPRAAAQHRARSTSAAARPRTTASRSSRRCSRSSARSSTSTSVKTFTVEVDPRRVDVERLRFYHAMGVNRLSFGVQDFDPEVQKEINRIQPPEIVARLLTPEIRSYFPTINFDLLIGLPKQTPQSIRETIQSRRRPRRRIRCRRCTSTTSPRCGSTWCAWSRTDPCPDFYDRKAIFVEATEGLMAAGYERAGFESFAKPGDVLASSMGEEKAYYNSLGTTTGDAINFISVGSSAHGVLGGEYYFQNYYEQERYREALAKGEFPIYRGYKLTPEDKLRADVIKRLRTYFRVDVAAIEDQWEIDFRSHFARELTTLHEFERDALVQFDQGGLALTDLGRHFAPQVASVFDSFLDRPAFNPEVVVHGA